MRFIVFSDREAHPAHAGARRYREFIDEALLADRFDFDAFRCSKQHVSIGAASPTAPEVKFCV